jgi:Flp pilus assembly protein TadD
VQNKQIKIDSQAKRAVLAAAAAACLVAAYFPVKWGLAGSAALRANILEVAQLTVDLAPSNPYAHLATAHLLESNFSLDDVERSLTEYETAAALSPHNYLIWLELGRALERNGDAEGAEQALRRAKDLAPNYARVQWALGNALLRQGRTNEGFEEIRHAVASDPKYTNAAANTAWQILDGDLAQVRSAIGDSPRLNAAIASLLAGQKRFDEAAEIWDGIPFGEKSGILQDTGGALLAQFLAAKKFRAAARVAGELKGGEAKIGEISNGGFEEDVKLQNAGPFEWQLGSGNQPQIAPTTGQKHGGENSLVVIFNFAESKYFRTISQTVPVQPGASYELELYYRSDLKTSVVLRWEIVDAEGKVLAATDPMAGSSEWAPLRAVFTVPENTDGITIRLARENCSGPVCPINGNLWLDDFTLRAANR